MSLLIILICLSYLTGAFLIPYILFLILCGMPMFYMELAVGQYFSRGPIGTWGAVCPLFQGTNVFIDLLYKAKKGIFF